jgi:hypothetical membrane protein
LQVSEATAFSIHIYVLAFWDAVLALFLSVAWKGVPRLEAIAACVLMAVGYHFSTYV